MLGRGLKAWREGLSGLAVRGWILDVYPCGPSDVAVWIIGEDGRRVRLTDRFTRKIYVYGDVGELERLPRRLAGSKSVGGYRFKEMYADFMEASRKRVLEIDVTDYNRLPFFSRKLLRLGGYGKLHVFNVDVPVSQAYMYDRDLFPLAKVQVEASKDGLSYSLLDSVEETDYEVPSLKTMWLDVEVKRGASAPRFSDEIQRLTVEFDDERVVLEGGDELHVLKELVSTVRGKDPDVIFTRGGDSFQLPYLAYRAYVNNALSSFILSRDNVPLRFRKVGGRTFFSYGRVYYRAPLRRLYGRVHIDVENTFIYKACGLEGLIEVSRTCRVPLHRASRASIGSIMSSLQLYTAWRSETLIPWKRHVPEAFKSAWDLLVADRGGFIFEPKVGFHTDVFEVDYASMYPMLMLKNNISAETVLCKCCPDSPLRVPELGYNICVKRKGIVPKTLELLLSKRFKYRELMASTGDEELKRIYSLRQAALKWILVTCFGYLGYRNARFGRVDAHMAVCAYARDTLLKTVRMAEEHGFEVVHGIVDSLWIKKEGATRKEVAYLCREASRVTGIPLMVEGRYRWIVFVPSKALPKLPVLNRYYGVFDDGRIKMRGVEARRADTPPFIAKAQKAMIEKLAPARSLEEFMERIPEALSAMQQYAWRLVKREVDVGELAITKRLSKRPSEYAYSVMQAIAAKQLEKAGYELHPGQTVSYIITDAGSSRPYERVLALPLVEGKAKYDVHAYLNMLVSAAETLLSAFGYTQEKLWEVIYGVRQRELPVNS
jgi:DNA polymerase elongation subunit (family B)